MPTVAFTGFDPTNPADLTFDFASLHRVGNTDKEKYGYFDYEQQFNFADHGVQVRRQYTDHDRVASFLATTYGSFYVPLGDPTDGVGCDGRPCTSVDFAGGSLPAIFLGNLAIPGRSPTISMSIRAKLRSILNGQPAANRARLLNPPKTIRSTRRPMAAMPCSSSVTIPRGIMAM